MADGLERYGAPHEGGMGHLDKIMQEAGAKVGTVNNVRWLEGPYYHWLGKDEEPQEDELLGRFHPDMLKYWNA